MVLDLGFKGLRLWRVVPCLCFLVVIVIVVGVTTNIVSTAGPGHQ